MRGFEPGRIKICHCLAGLCCWRLGDGEEALLVQQHQQQSLEKVLDDDEKEVEDGEEEC